LIAHGNVAAKDLGKCTAEEITVEEEEYQEDD
jgi:hypothetical protein